MALTDDAALWDWHTAAGPSDFDFEAVRVWVANLARRPAQFPSIPLPDLWFPGEDEIRVAILDVSTDVEVFYWHDLVNDDVELIFVRYTA